MKKIITLLIVLAIIIFCVEAWPAFRGIIGDKIDTWFQGGPQRTAHDAEWSFNRG